MSARSSSAGSASNEPEAPPKRWASAIARSRRRLATNIVETPWSCRAWATSSEVSPAPMISTWRSARSPTVARAASTATEATLARPTEMAVSVRTRLPVASAARKSLLVIGPVVRAESASSYARLTWPCTSASPTIIDSRPLVTRYSWRAASQLRSEYMPPISSVGRTPARRASSPSTNDSASTGSETTR